MTSTGREFPSRPLVGVGAVVLSPRGVALIQRGKPPRVGSWSLPGGAQKVGETVFEAALREVKEETGLDVEILGLVDVVDSITHAPDGRVHYHYTLIDVVATCDPDQEPRAGGDAQGAAWIRLDDLEPLSLWSETERVVRKAHGMWQALQAL